MRKRIWAIVGTVVVLMSLSPVTGVLGTNAGRPTSETPPAHGSGKAGMPINDWAGYGQFRMIDLNTGWVVANGQRAVLRSTDGGSTWRDVSPTAITSSSNREILASYFRDTSTAWVAASTSNSSGNPAVHSSVVVYSTSDGGEHWRASTLSSAEAGAMTPISLSFVTVGEGWLLVGLNGRQTVSIFHTVDGGIHWSEVSSTGLGGHSQNGLPPDNTKVGISFLNRSMGFMSVVQRDYTPSPMYQTADGGRTWKSVTITLVDRDFDFATPPTFFNDRQGAFAVIYTWNLMHDTISAGLQSMSLVTYVTENGGKSWREAGVLAYSVDKSATSPGPMPFFLTPATGYVTGSDELFSTTDGYLTWSNDFPPMPRDINRVNFVSTSAGWGVGLEGQLYQTKDGGHTWTNLSPRMLMH